MTDTNLVKLAQRDFTIGALKMLERKRVRCSRGRVETRSRRLPAYRGRDVELRTEMGHQRIEPAWASARARDHDRHRAGGAMRQPDGCATGRPSAVRAIRFSAYQPAHRDAAAPRACEAHEPVAPRLEGHLHRRLRVMRSALARQGRRRAVGIDQPPAEGGHGPTSIGPLARSRPVRQRLCYAGPMALSVEGRL